YDPVTGRFISSDNLSILDETLGDINGLNLYAYCSNNPVMRVDKNGCSWSSFWEGTKNFFSNPIVQIVIGVIVIAALAVATVFTAGAAGIGVDAALVAGFTGASLTAAVGASAGAALAVTILSAAFTGAVIGSAVGFVAGGMTFTNGNIGWSWESAANGFMWGSITGAAAAGGSVVSSIGSNISKKVVFGIIQGTLNAGIGAGITAVQGLITNEFEWETVVISAFFGALGGVIGSIFTKPGIRNIIISLGSGFAEGAVGEFVEWIKSKHNLSYISSNTWKLLYN
ncbi:MAG: hypothetical protein LBV51_04440, partial [Acholeplasmatales bacterium]|nr:hypothetical protein [Acholeplasmatales bacterium]